jgi:hypothetical protein
MSKAESYLGISVRELASEIARLAPGSVLDSQAAFGLADVVIAVLYAKRIRLNSSQKSQEARRAKGLCVVAGCSAKPWRPRASYCRRHRRKRALSERA